MNTPGIDPRMLGEEPAHPYSQVTESYHQAYAQHRGITKREEFAKAALQALLSNPHVVQGLHAGDYEKTVHQMAVYHADELLAELARTSL